MDIWMTLAATIAVVLILLGTAPLVLDSAGRPWFLGQIQRLGQPAAGGFFIMAVLSVVALAAVSVVYFTSPPLADDSTLRTLIREAARIIAFAPEGLGLVAVVLILLPESTDKFLDQVQSQKTFDTGGSATEDQVHWAMSGTIPGDEANQMIFDD